MASGRWIRGFPGSWRWPLLHGATVLLLVVGLQLGTLADICHSGLEALGLPWSALWSDALGRVDKENEILGGLRELVLFIPAFANVAVHVVLVWLGSRRRAGTAPSCP